MIVGISTVNYDILMQNLKFIGFANDNHTKPLKSLLKQNIDTYPNYIEKLLIAITGVPNIPAFGYSKNKELTIELYNYYDKTNLIPFILHTCFNKLDLNNNAYFKYIDATDDEKINTELYKYFQPEILTKMSEDHSLA